MASRHDSVAGMGMEGLTDWRDAAVSALDWWREAGVDIVIDDLPRDWSARPILPTDAIATENAVAPVAIVEEAPLPATLEAFVDWRLGGDAPESNWGEPMIAASGDPSAPLMILTDMPEPGDAEADMLLSGDAGRLFDRMLAAIGMDRGSVYLAPLCAARPITGQMPREAEKRLAELARHHIALAAPRMVLMLGQTVSRAILGPEGGAMRGRLQPINHQDGQSSVVSTFHPRFLLTKPTVKADSWRDLQLLIGEQSL